MEKNRKSIRRIFWAVYLTLCLGLGALIAALDLSGGTAAVLGTLLAGAGAAAVLAIDLRWYRELNGELAEMHKLLHTDTERFLAENERLLGNCRSASLRAAYRLNLCAGLCERGQWAEARAQLEQLEPKKLRGPLRAAWLLDMAYISFYLHEDGLAQELLRENRDFLARYGDAPGLDVTAAVVRIFSLAAAGERDTAREMLENARARWPDSAYQSDYEELHRRLEA